MAIAFLLRLISWMWAERDTREVQQHHHAQNVQDHEGMLFKSIFLFLVLSRPQSHNLTFPPTARLSRLEVFAQKVEVGVESLGHKLESGVVRALCSISSSVSHMHGIEGQHQLCLGQEVAGQDHLIRVLSEVKMLEDESDAEAEEVFSD